MIRSKLNFKWISALFLVVLAGMILRIVNLGYADYQGDEIKAFYLPAPGQSIPEFLFTQRKGPLQFIITGILTLVDPLYENQLLMRFFFSLAGCLALLFFSLLAASLYGKRISIYATLFMVTNGILVGLSRIAQYQSYVILGGLLALYFFNKARQDSRFEISGVYFGFASWALAILAHYDAFLIAPMAIYLLLEWLHSGTMPGRNKIKHLLASAGIAAVPVVIFYVPFILYIDAETKVYWTQRLMEEAAEKISSSILLFQIYQPIYVLPIYLFLFIAGLTFLTGLLINRKKGSVKNWTPADISGNEFIRNLLATFLWFLAVFILMEVVIYQPGTHIYTYLIPAFVFLGLGLFAIEQLIKHIGWIKRSHEATLAIFSVLFLFLFVQSYAIFVDSNQEYPWEDERFIFWTLKQPSTTITDEYTLSMFGFPYFRDWESIGKYIQDHSDFNTVSANEPDVVTNFYVRKSGRRFSPYRYYISIQNPRSFVPFLNERMAALVNTQKPVYRIVEDEETLAEIFLIEIR